MNSFIVTPEDEMIKEISGYKFILRPMTAKEFFSKAFLLTNLGTKLSKGETLSDKELSNTFNFLASMIKYIDGVEGKIDAEYLYNFKPGVVLELIKTISEMITLTEVEKSFR